MIALLGMVRLVLLLLRVRGWIKQAVLLWLHHRRDRYFALIPMALLPPRALMTASNSE